jgi:hypothetical protein
MQHRFVPVMAQYRGDRLATETLPAFDRVSHLRYLVRSGWNRASGIPRPDFNSVLKKQVAPQRQPQG